MAPGTGARLGDLVGLPAMSIFRQDSLSEEVNRESSSITTVAGGGMALQFKTSISSTTSSSTQTSSETVLHRMSGEWCPILYIYLDLEEKGNETEALFLIHIISYLA